MGGMELPIKSRQGGLSKKGMFNFYIALAIRAIKDRDFFEADYYRNKAMQVEDD